MPTSPNSIGANNFTAECRSALDMANNSPCKSGAKSKSTLPCFNVHRTWIGRLYATSALRTKNAIDRISSLGGVASSQHILIADQSGALAMELSPLGNAYIPPNKYGYIAHTNHFTANKCGVTEPHWPGIGSHERLARMNELMNGLEGESGYEHGEIRDKLRQRIFSDMFNSPATICCMENPVKPIETKSRTYSYE
ncbi:hypothetical protein B0H13DRAFT_2565109 [Mycena leptocephala]|nr:hypothetical protein B0H13DRAFT_2565109 [Mycena leptocephala]